MKNSTAVLRSFLRRALRSSLLLATLGVTEGIAASPIADEHRIGGFAVGPQAFSFKLFTVFEAIEKTAQTGSKVIEFSGKQKLVKERPDVVFNHDSPDDVIASVQAKLREHGIRPVNYGVVAIPNDEAGARKVFDFARRMNLYAITTESDGSIDLIEKLVREYDIRVGFHNHARRPNNPAYKLWDPRQVRALVRNRDPRIGACADIGHWQTTGLTAVDGLRVLEGRIISLHCKDRGALGPGQHDVIFGTGITDIGGVLAELRRQKFEGNIAIEYEYNWTDSVSDIAQCVGFIRGWAAAQAR
jgi:sugar phosphate isomerase/epimerase